MPTPRTGRPRGRPAGSRNLPPLSALIAQSLSSVPHVPLKPKRKPSGIWATLKTPEERSAYSRKLAALRTKPPSGGRKPGVPAAFTAKQYAALIEQQTPIVRAAMERMAQDGTLPEDPKAAEAIETALLILRTSAAPSIKMAAARLLLDFLAPPPVARRAIVETAEDLLDAITAANARAPQHQSNQDQQS